MSDREKFKIGVLTGKRGGFGAMRPMMRLIEADDDCELHLFVTDQHLMPYMGETVREIEASGFRPEYVDIDHPGDTPGDRLNVYSDIIGNLDWSVDERNLDVMILLGDRIETLAGAIVALHHQIPIAHIQGGDKTGTFDDTHRKMIEQAASFHFVSTVDSANNLDRKVFYNNNIHIVGDIHIDAIYNASLLSEKSLLEKLSLTDTRPIIIILQHPNPEYAHIAYEQMQQTMNAVANTQCQAVVIYPCTDEGHMGTIRCIEEYRELSYIRIFPNLEHDTYLSLLGVANLLIGNSSSGIIEANYLGTYSIDIGTRQEGRIRPASARHTIHSTMDIQREINNTLMRASAGEPKRENLYGKGRTGEQIIRILKEEIYRW